MLPLATLIFLFNKNHTVIEIGEIAVSLDFINLAPILIQVLKVGETNLKPFKCIVYGQAISSGSG